MKSLHLIFILIFTLLFGINKSQADHIDAAEMSVDYAGSGLDYSVNLSVYSKSQGLPLGNSIVISYNSGCGSGSLTLNLLNQESVPYCDFNNTQPSFETFTKYNFNGQITIPSNCSNYTFYYSSSEGTENAINATDKTFTSAEVKTPSSMVGSGSFNNNPVFSSPAGKPFNLDVSIDNAIADSIVYKLNSLSGLNQTSFNSGYSFQNPWGNNAASINQRTGIIELITPANTGIYVYTVQVESYLNGLLVSSCSRDVYITSYQQNANQYNPELTGINGSNNYDTTICAGSSFGGYSHFSDFDNGQIVSVSMKNPLNFTTQNTNFGRFNYGWNTTTSMASDKPYNFYISVDDGFCGANTFCISIKLDNCLTSLTEKGDSNGLVMDLYPNPVSTILRIKMPSKSLNGVFEIFTLSGQKIFQQATSGLVNKFDVSSLDQGVYIIQFTGKDEKLTDRLVVSR